MNSKNTIIIGIIVLAIIGGIFFTQRKSTGNEKMMDASDASMEKTQIIEETSMMEKKDVMEKTTEAMEKPDTMMKKESRYVDYTQAAFDAAKGKQRVYFFHASWCPTCKAASTEITSNLERIPENVVLFKTDYDSNSALKKQYGITYQHTFVLVDDMGKEVKKWNGGGLVELAANTK